MSITKDNIESVSSLLSTGNLSDSQQATIEAINEQVQNQSGVVFEQYLMLVLMVVVTAVPGVMAYGDFINGVFNNSSSGLEGKFDEILEGLRDGGDVILK